MERAVYFDAWFSRQHCYHPSLPARRLQMVADLVDYRATMLVWSGLGGGSVSLPYLEHEARGPIPPRFRFYGFINDVEFIREVQRRGIKVFGIIFEVQGWEFPVELNEAEDTILALNELRGVGKRAWIGLREFSQNRYPKLWAPFEKYFPRGLINSAGEKVTDLIAECCSRDIYGEPCHAEWVECPDREHQCFMMDRNNPVWREYLKAVIRIQIDAGVDGIQLDEAELPIASIFSGGCFCRDCMHGFREYLQELPTEQLPFELKGFNLETFHYGEWLLQQGYDFKKEREQAPLIWEYLRFQRRAIKRYFAELACYAREYAASQGRTVMVSGNFYNLFDQNYPLEPEVDLIITEMRNTLYRQPEWYRYVAGFAADKPVIVVENPFGGIIPELLANLQSGRGYDLFRMSLYEAAALGANMSVPYGCWMGNVIQDAFYAPHTLCLETQHFLAEHEQLYSPHTYSDTAIVYSMESNFKPVTRNYLFQDDNKSVSGLKEIPFWSICQAFSNANQPYDVIFFPDGKLRADELTLDDVYQYHTMILPECHYLTLAQADLLLAYLKQGGRLFVLGEMGLNLPATQRRSILNHPGALQHEDLDTFQLGQLPGGTQLHLSPSIDLATNIQRVAAGAALHLIRYDYSIEQDCVPLLPELELKLRLPDKFSALEVFSPGAVPQASLAVSDGLYRLSLRNVPLYTIVLLKNAKAD